VATVLFTALHNLLMQSSEALLFLQNIRVEVISYMWLEICFCAHSLVVDHMSCSRIV